MFTNKVLGFNVNGIGNGHITQAKMIYKCFMKYNIQVPIVVIYGRKQCIEITNMFPLATLIFKKTQTTNESMNNNNILKLTYDLFSNKKTLQFEKSHGINTWINFFAVDLFNTSTSTKIQVSSQICLPNIELKILKLLFRLNSQKLVSLVDNPSFVDHSIPSLISTDNISRKRINNKLILAYSVSGTDFHKTLKQIASNNPKYIFHYFTNSDVRVTLPKNCHLYKPSGEFKQFLKICGGVLCTSGNELIQECCYNEIPVATMPCSSKQYEQVYNCNLYVNKLKFASKMSSDMNLNSFVSKNNKSICNEFKQKLRNQDNAILKILEL